MDRGAGVGSAAGAVERGVRTQRTWTLLERRTALSGTPVNMFKNTRNMRRTHSEILNRNKAKVYPCTEKDLINFVNKVNSKGINNF